MRILLKCILTSILLISKQVYIFSRQKKKELYGSFYSCVPLFNFVSDFYRSYIVKDQSQRCNTPGCWSYIMIDAFFEMLHQFLKTLTIDLCLLDLINIIIEDSLLDNLHCFRNTINRHNQSGIFVISSNIISIFCIIILQTGSMDSESAFKLQMCNFFSFHDIHLLFQQSVDIIWFYRL